MGSVAIIGAGISGLACANQLAAAGHEIVLFDKGRGPGGRMSTRRMDTPMGQAHFDHGAQFFAARDPAFQAEVARLLTGGAASLWDGTFVRFDPAGVCRDQEPESRYIGTPGMNAIVRGLAVGLNTSWGLRVTALSGQKGAWHLAFESGETRGPFDQVICAVPAEQVSDLIGPHVSNIAARADRVRSLPCWAGLFAFESPLPLDWDMARFDGHPVLDVISTSLHKPGRSGPATYVVHGHADWSIAHLEEPADVIASALHNSFADVCGPLPTPLIQTAHRWRYARVETRHGPGYAYEPALGLGACGDWLSGPRVESAWLSGHHLGQHLLG